MKIARFVLAGLIVAAPAAVWAQGGQAAAPANYIDLSVGTGKVELDCTNVTLCSRVDSSSVVRLGHRFDPSWAMELSYGHIDADWGILGSRKSAKFNGYGVGAAYTLPVSDSLGVLARGGVWSNHLEFVGASALLGTPATKVNTNAVKPYVGVAGAWQFAQHWSLNISADWTRAALRETPNGAKSDVTVRLVGAGVAFHF